MTQLRCPFAASANSLRSACAAAGLTPSHSSTVVAFGPPALTAIAGSALEGGTVPAHTVMLCSRCRRAHALPQVHHAPHSHRAHALQLHWFAGCWPRRLAHNCWRSLAPPHLLRCRAHAPLQLLQALFGPLRQVWGHGSRHALACSQNQAGAPEWPRSRPQSLGRALQRARRWRNAPACRWCLAFRCQTPGSRTLPQPPKTSSAPDTRSPCSSWPSPCELQPP